MAISYIDIGDRLFMLDIDNFVVMKEIKQAFSWYYNKRHNRRGTLWGERFKSVMVESGQTLINCLAYIDLNPVRAAIVERPED
jgi:putative transposase